MEFAKVFQYGNSQAINLPDKYRFKSDEVVIQRLGYSLILTPKNEVRENLLHNIVSQRDTVTSTIFSEMCNSCKNLS